jgi:GNAT superfamily N-acetyltransferase
MSTVRGEEFEPPSGLFLALIEDDVVLAGGGFRRLTPDVCEIKRMWTHPDHRQQGHASTILKALEEEARTDGYVALRLETGPAQPEAVALYSSRGYRRIAAYGRYARAVAFELVL